MGTHHPSKKVPNTSTLPRLGMPQQQPWHLDEVTELDAFTATDVDPQTEVDVRQLQNNAPQHNAPHRAVHAPIEPSPPSRQDLLQRAAELGPRMTWESVYQPNDPILGEKMLPHVAERRARFRKVVKVALGTCIACCLFAVGVSAVAGPSSSHAAASLKTTPAAGVVPIEKLDQPTHTKRGSSYVVAVASRPAKKR